VKFNIMGDKSLWYTTYQFSEKSWRPIKDLPPTNKRPARLNFIRTFDNARTANSYYISCIKRHAGARLRSFTDMSSKVINRLQEAGQGEVVELMENAKDLWKKL
jgi:hypothetical protein